MSNTAVPSTLCVQPWIHLATWNDGKVPLCCIAQPEDGLDLNLQTPSEVWNSPQFKTARLQFLGGEKPSQCSACWREEAAGVTSHRQIENRMWRRKLGDGYIDGLINSTHTDGSVAHNPITLDLRLGNTCNLQCVMCRPTDSSRWLADSRRLAQTLTKPSVRGDWQWKANSIPSTDIFDWFSRLETQHALAEFMGDIRHIIFGGGEPLMIKEHLRFITGLVEGGWSSNITLRYHTNGTQLSEEFIDLWSKFQRVELMISLDDWGPRAEYVRYPTHWPTVIANLDRLDRTPSVIVVNILATVHAMNIYNLPDFAQSILDHGWQKIGLEHGGLFSTGVTHWPQYLNTRVLLPHVKREIMEYWGQFDRLAANPRWADRITSQLDFMNGGDDSFRYGDLLEYIRRLDDLRPMKFSDRYPQYWSILTRYGD